MMEQDKKRDEKHLANLICNRSEQTPNFALLMGAGSSASSGVKTADEMVREWRTWLHEQDKGKETFQKWLKKQDWYEDEEEYSILFEKICDERSQRRIYIENCVKDAKPSWGYIYLANLIKNRCFDTILTPNFDDLLNEACFVYADMRPIVCAHDSAVADIRVTSARPKIIKLHGDYLYDSIKNTVRETEFLERNMRDKFLQFGREYGIVVVGYGGNDRSIMDILDAMVRSEEYLPNGIYWCVRKTDKIGNKLTKMMRRDNIYWVEIEGFDEFMAGLHERMGLVLPDSVRDPYKATTDRLNSFILPTGTTGNEVIKKDMEEVGKQIRVFEKAISSGESGGRFDQLVPYKYLADTDIARNRYDSGLINLEKALIQKPNDKDTLGMIARICISEGEYERAIEIAEQVKRIDPGDYRGYLSEAIAYDYNGERPKAISECNEGLGKMKSPMGMVALLILRSNMYLKMNEWKKALDDAEKSLEIQPNNNAARVNKSGAFKGMGKIKEMNELLQVVLEESNDDYILAVANALLGNRKEMLDRLKRAIDNVGLSKVLAKHDPEFQEYRDDKDFVRLVEGQTNES